MAISHNFSVFSDMKPEFFPWISSFGRHSKPNPYFLGERKCGTWGKVDGLWVTDTVLLDRVRLNFGKVHRFAAEF